MMRSLSLLLCLSAAGLITSPARGAEKLNVLLVVSDDLNCDIGCYGHRQVQTPHIDRLAARGMRFDRAYCQYPLCNPSRASFMTGRRPDRTGVVDNGRHFRDVDPEIVTLPQTFMNAGYATARVGKLYHYGVPGMIGTDGLDDSPSWHQVVNPKGRDVAEEDLIFTLRPEAEGPRRFGGTLSWLSADGTDEEQTDGIGATEAIRLLEQLRGEPFFLAVGFYRPHTPFVAPHRYFDLYPLDEIRVPEVPDDIHQRHPELAFQRKPEQEKMTERQKRECIQAYYASISFMDAQLGRLLNALERLELADNTLVVFTSDHGYHMGEKGMWQKMSLFEGSARVPLVIAVPGQEGGRYCRRTVELIDLHATLAELCGLDAPQEQDGVSLVPLLDDPATAWDRPAFTQVHRPPRQSRVGRSIRTERWRYTEWEEGRSGRELYDYDNDPDETTNLADDPAHAETVRRLRERLYATMARGSS